RRPPRRLASASSVAVRSSRDASASRIWNWMVWPTRTRSATATAPVAWSIPTRLRTRKSPRSSGDFAGSIARPAKTRARRVRASPRGGADDGDEAERLVESVEERPRAEPEPVGKDEQTSALGDRWPDPLRHLFACRGPLRREQKRRHHEPLVPRHEDGDRGSLLHLAELRQDARTAAAEDDARARRASDRVQQLVGPRPGVARHEP